MNARNLRTAIGVLIAAVILAVPTLARSAPAAGLIEPGNPCAYSGAVCGTVAWSNTPAIHWATIDDAGHGPSGIASVETTTTYVRVHFTFTATRVGSCAVTPDEAFARDVRTGASVGVSYLDIYFWMGTNTVPTNPALLSRAGANVWIMCFMEREAP